MTGFRFINFYFPVFTPDLNLSEVGLKHVEAVSGFSCVEIIALSSAYFATKVVVEVGWSAVNMLKSRGAVIAPWRLRLEFRSSKIKKNGNVLRIGAREGKI